MKEHNNLMSMMEHVNFDPENEDDLYSGFNEYNATFDVSALHNDAGFQNAVQTSYGRRPPPTGANLSNINKSGKGTNLATAMGARPITGAVVGDGSGRPMTAMRAVGYNSVNKQSGFDPMGHGNRSGPAPPLETKNEDTPEEKVKVLEKKINIFIMESCLANGRGEVQSALTKAKDAARNERYLVRQREQLTSSDQHNLDLTYSVLFNLANQYDSNEMYAESLNTYQVIVKNKMFSNSGRLKVNIGNIYFKEKSYAKAVKFYRMALDQVPNSHKFLRIKIMKNCGISFVKLGQYNDAITSFEYIMTEEPNTETGFNLILCYYALNDKEKMKQAFVKLLTVDLKLDDDEKYIAANDDKHNGLILEAIKDDSLRTKEKKKKADAERNIKMASKVISPVVESTYSAGYDWCIDQVKNSAYMELAHDLEIDKAIGYLKQKDFGKAIETLKSFEKKDTKVACTAATNLAFLYFLEAEFSNSDKYADVALIADRYNPSALVNKGNIFFAKGDFEKAREYYREALQNDSSCVEGLYNLGLTHKRLKIYDESLESFYKLHTILRNSPQVIFQIADIHEQIGERSQAIEWFMQLIGIVPTDANILKRLGEMYDAEGDKSQAFQYHYDSYRYNPSNIKVIEWLGAYYIESQFFEKAIQYFERASLIQPNQVQWKLMVASCHRRSGNYQLALETYKVTNKRFPDNIDCLKFLIRLCTDMGLKDTQEYTEKLKKAEKQATLKQERANSATRRGSGRKRITDSRENSAGSEIRRNTRERKSGKSLKFSEDEPYQISNRDDIDTSYDDPLGPAPERPRTAAIRRSEKHDDDFADEELGEDLLPD